MKPFAILNSTQIHRTFKQLTVRHSQQLQPFSLIVDNAPVHKFMIKYHVIDKTKNINHQQEENIHVISKSNIVTNTLSPSKKLQGSTQKPMTRRLTVGAESPNINEFKRAPIFAKSKQLSKSAQEDESDDIFSRTSMRSQSHNIPIFTHKHNIFSSPSQRKQSNNIRQPKEISQYKLFQQSQKHQYSILDNGDRKSQKAEIIVKGNLVQSKIINGQYGSGDQHKNPIDKKRSIDSKDFVRESMEGSQNRSERLIPVFQPHSHVKSRILHPESDIKQVKKSQNKNEQYSENSQIKSRKSSDANKIEKVSMKQKKQISQKQESDRNSIKSVDVSIRSLNQQSKHKVPIFTKNNKIFHDEAITQRKQTHSQIYDNQPINISNRQTNEQNNNKLKIENNLNQYQINGSAETKRGKQSGNKKNVGKPIQIQNDFGSSKLSQPKLLKSQSRRQSQKLKQSKKSEHQSILFDSNISQIEAASIHNTIEKAPNLDLENMLPKQPKIKGINRSMNTDPISDSMKSSSSHSSKRSIQIVSLQKMEPLSIGIGSRNISQGGKLMASQRSQTDSIASSQAVQVISMRHPIPLSF